MGLLVGWFVDFSYLFKLDCLGGYALKLVEVVGLDFLYYWLIEGVFQGRFN